MSLYKVTWRAQGEGSLRTSYFSRPFALRDLAEYLELYYDVARAQVYTIEEIR